MIKQNEEVAVPVAWFEGLVKLADRYENANGISNKEMVAAMLVGYASSAKVIIKFRKRINDKT